MVMFNVLHAPDHFLLQHEDPDKPLGKILKGIPESGVARDHISSMLAR